MFHKRHKLNVSNSLSQQKVTQRIKSSWLTSYATISENRLINSRNKRLVVTSTDPTPCQIYHGHIQQWFDLQNLDNPKIHIDQVIEEASKIVLACYRTREANMSATKYDIKTEISPYILKVLQPTADAFDLHVWHANSEQRPSGQHSN